MLSIKRNQVVITALVVMIAVAGYLSYIDRAPGIEDDDNSLVLTDTGEVSALIVDSANGQEIPVISLNQASDDEISISSTYEEGSGVNNEQSAEPGEAVFVNSLSDTSFFVQAKLEREQGRSKQREVLTEMINSTNLEKEKKAECADKLLDIQDRYDKETSAEAMIEAKGFGDAYVRIDDETVDVIVTKSELTEIEIAQIEDIVNRKTGMSIDQIRISSSKKN